MELQENDRPNEDEPRLLQYHVAQLYKFLQEYKNLQDQLRSIHSAQISQSPSFPSSLMTYRSIDDGSQGPTNQSQSVSGIQSSIEYLLAHKACIPPPIIDTINNLSTNRERQDMPTPNLILNIPPPPNYSFETTCDSIPNTLIKSQTSPEIIPTTALPSMIPPPSTPPVGAHSMFSNNTSECIALPSNHNSYQRSNVSEGYENTPAIVHQHNDDHSRLPSNLNCHNISKGSVGHPLQHMTPSSNSSLSPTPMANQDIQATVSSSNTHFSFGIADDTSSSFPPNCRQKVRRAPIENKNQGLQNSQSQ